MRRLLWFLLFGGLMAIFCHDGKAQPAQTVRFVISDPSGACGTASYITVNVAFGSQGGDIGVCVAGTWQINTSGGGGGGGGVASVSGTTNEITADPTTGAVVVGLPSPTSFPGNVTVPEGSLSVGTSGTACAWHWYNADGTDLVWNCAATGVNAALTYDGSTPTAGYLWGISGSCTTGPPIACPVGFVPAPPIAPASATLLGTNSAAQFIPASTTGTGTTAVLAASPTLTGTPLAPTITPAASNSTQIANAAFTQNAINLSMATIPMSGITGGTYSYASLGSGLVVNYTASGNAITAATVTAGGSGYAVGDMTTVNLGNLDSVLRIATVSGTAAATLTILYGGTGYPNGTGFTGTTVPTNAVPFTFTLTGALTSAATFIMPNGPSLVLSNQWIVNNNTTGAHTVTFCISSGSDACTGTGVVIAQGTSNSAGTLIETDGFTDIWLVAAPFITINGTNCPAGGSCTLSGPVHSAGATFSGGGVQAAQVYCCVTVPAAGTIVGWDITVDDGTGAGTCASCTATVKFWKVATGTSTPTSANSISTSGVSLSSGTAVHSTTVSDFTTTSVAANDIIAFDLSAVANAVVVNVDIQIQ